MYELLRGLRVVEAASFIAAPSATLYLEQMGAEVIRIDQLGGGPDYNRWPLSGGASGKPERSLYWEGLNKGKRSVALDLSRPEGRELAVALITAPGDDAGLFVTNFPASGFLSYERLKPLRPDLICVRVMGWPDGRQAVDYTVNAAVGIPLMTGPQDRPDPVNHVLPAWDLLAGAYAAFSLVSAERSRRDGGQGCEIRLPLSDIAIAAMGNLGMIAEVSLTGQDRVRTGNDLFGAFGRDFVTRDGKRLMVVAITPRQWSGLIATLGIEVPVAAVEAECGVSFAADEGLRFQHRERLTPIFAEAFAGRDSAELAPEFERRGVCWGPYQTLAEAVARDPSLSAGNPMLAPVDHPGGRYLTPGPAASIPGNARATPRPAPVLGQDTEDVLATILNLPGHEIARLRDAGLIA